MPPSSATIPARAHFVWFGEQFRWVNVLAVRSAALRGGFDEVVLHHDSELSANEHYRELAETPGVTLRRLDVSALLQRCEPHTAGLQELYDRLRTPQTRSDLARFAILYSEGGIYLDIDTVTVSNFARLLTGVSTFFGLERIVYPAEVRSSRDPRIRIPAYFRALLRDLLRRLPDGWKLFRRLEHFYPLAANPAILAASARSPFIDRAIQTMLSIPKERQTLPFVIGPHLLQRMAKEYQATDVAVHGSELFYPLGPEISQHWFRIGGKVDLEKVLTQRTCLVHWYASTLTRSVTPRIDPDYVRKHARRQLFSALALPFLASPG
jgi:hypothetical protein